jgi:Ca-activated chloride channel family protein
MKPLTSVVITAIVAFAVVALVVRTSDIGREAETVTIVHWTTGHLLRDGSGLRLLRQMAKEFNDAEHRTASDKRIKVEVYYLGGAEQAPELVSRVTRGVSLDRKLPDPTLVTPSASHWLAKVNFATGTEVINLDNTLSRSLARSYVGIVTYRDMAECLGWPAKDIGYADIIALRDDPRGWSHYPCARAEWGERPLVAFTDPSASDTGRAVLISLYAIAAGKEPQELTAADLQRPEVVSYVKHFQRLVDHYMISTIPLNTKIYQGPRYGHFFIMPEDNLIHLYEGTEVALENGVEVQAPPIERDIVMIYPTEGSLLRENCACLVNASWVDAEKQEGARQWVEYLRQDNQQRSFMAAGFRPGTDLPVTQPISPKYGLYPAGPRKVIQAERVDPAIAEAIDDSWEEVKRPAIVTFVIDASSSMAGEKLDQAEAGTIRALDNMAGNNQVGFIAFNGRVQQRIGVAPLTTNKFAIAGAVKQLTATGRTALYDAIRTGIEMSDQAPGDSDWIRAVVVLTDGKSNEGTTVLHDLVTMMSANERPIVTCAGMENNLPCQDDSGKQVSLQEVNGTRLALPTRHSVQIFFIGIGDADMEIGRILSLATGAEFQGSTDKDLAKLLEAISKYF